MSGLDIALFILVEANLVCIGMNIVKMFSLGIAMNVLAIAMCITALVV